MKQSKYSQSEEEHHIVKYFNGDVGTFCSIGENDGITLSNVRRLYELGWKGICIEPSPEAFKRLKENYKGIAGVYLYPFAIGTHNGRLRFWDSGTHLNRGDVALLSTSNPEEMKRFPGTEYKEMEVKCFRWKTALNRFVIKKFDMISIDAEGINMEILEQIDLSEVKLLVIEWNGNEALRGEVMKYCAKYGLFTIYYTSGENLIIVR